MPFIKVMLAGWAAVMLMYFGTILFSYAIVSIMI